MTKRTRVITATILTIIAITLLLMTTLGGADLKAAGVDEVGFDFSRFLVGGGVGLLVVSALLFVSSSAE